MTQRCGRPLQTRPASPTGIQRTCYRPAGHTGKCWSEQRYRSKLAVNRRQYAKRKQDREPLEEIA